MTKNQFHVIGFDADDTLWVNEPFFREAEAEFCQLLSAYSTEKETIKKLYQTEIQNLEPYGYGIKAFVLSMIETAQQITAHHGAPQLVSKIIEIGKSMLSRPVEVLEGVKETLAALHAMDYRLIIATKGDLLDQERKLEKSGLEKYFQHVEIMSDKQLVNYQRLFKHLDIEGENFLMVGNSLRSDIFPVLEAGGHGAYIPFHTVWAYENTVNTNAPSHFHELISIRELIPTLNLSF